MALNLQGKYLVVIAGATAVGKTDLAIQLAKHYRTVVVSADSRQIYAEMSIGTAKPETEQLEQVPHYFIGNKSIQTLYGAGHYAEEARQLLDHLFTKHDVIILAGGSGLYIDALLNGVDEFEEVPQELRTQLNSLYAERGITWLQEQVRSKDPEFAETADMSNPQRLIRALEVMTHSGKTFSSYRKKASLTNSFTAIKILVNTTREKLYQRINTRVDLMMAAGLLEEVKSLQEKEQLNALKTVGYRELYEYLKGNCSLEEAVSKIKQHTRNYAKRQLTWFRNRDSFTELPVEDAAGVINFIESKIRSFENNAGKQNV